MAEYIEREAAIEKLNKLCDRVCQYSKAQRKYMCGACPLGDAFTVIEDDIPAADVRPVTVCTNCEHNNHCLTQEFVEDCGKIPLDRNTFFCADGERRSNA